MGRVELTSAHCSLLERRLVVAVLVAVPAAVAPFVAVEVLGRTVPAVMRFVAMMGIFAVIAVIRPVVIVDIAMKMFRAVKPWAGADKNAIGKPLRTVITIRSATIWWGIVVTVRTNGRYTDADANLGLCPGST